MTPLDNQNQSSFPSPVLQNELLPCPHCGETDIRVELTNHYGNVYCSECGAEVHAAVPRTIEEAKKRWNARSPAPDVQRLQQEKKQGLEEKETQPDLHAARPTDGAWVSVSDRLPSVKEKCRGRFLVTARRANGKLYADVAAFCNNYWLEWAGDYEGDDIDENGGKRWNGWMEDRLDSGGDEISCAFDGEVIAWMPFPAPSDPSGNDSSSATSVSSPDSPSSSSALKGLEAEPIYILTRGYKPDCALGRYNKEEREAYPLTEDEILDVIRRLSALATAQADADGWKTQFRLFGSTPEAAAKGVNEEYAKEVKRRLASEADAAVMREALEYYRDECSGNEPSVSAFHRMLDNALATNSGKALLEDKHRLDWIERLHAKIEPPIRVGETWFGVFMPNGFDSGGYGLRQAIDRAREDVESTLNRMEPTPAATATQKPERLAKAEQKQQEE